jgi:hypothetical protein
MNGFQKRLIVFMMTTMLLAAGTAWAGVPIFTIEGEGGGGLTPWAYLTNPPKDGALFGKPAVGASYIFPTNFQLSLYHINETIGDRLELGFTRTIYDTSQVTGQNGTLEAGVQEVVMDTWHAKVVLVSASVEFKDNKDIALLNDRLGGALALAGLDDDNGVDYVVSVTKLFKSTPLGMPVLCNLSGRYSEAYQTGYLGFVDDGNFLPEISIAVLPESNVAVGFEYRWKPDEMDDISAAVLGLTGANKVTLQEDDWADFFIAYFPTPGLSITGAIVNFGNLVDRKVNSGLYMNMKYDF